MSDANEHAQVGALLAKCRYFMVEESSLGCWSAEVEVACGVFGNATRDTQLAAIRAAVEAAEKGVRE